MVQRSMGSTSTKCAGVGIAAHSERILHIPCSPGVYEEVYRRSEESLLAWSAIVALARRGADFDVDVGLVREVLLLAARYPASKCPMLWPGFSRQLI